MAQRKKNEDALLLALACGATVEAAAKQCGVHDRTVYRRMQDPEFQTQLKAIRSDMVRRAAGTPAVTRWRSAISLAPRGAL